MIPEKEKAGNGNTHSLCAEEERQETAREQEINHKMPLKKKGKVS